MGLDGKIAQYAPAQIVEYSNYTSESEVLFPPHVRFRVVNVKGSLVQLETTEFPSVWEMIKKKDWAGFKTWADGNKERIDTKECSYSVISHVAKHCVSSGTTAPLEVCVGHHADINEEDPQTGDTPLLIAAEAVKATGKVGDVAIWCLAAGANVHMKNKKGTAAVDIAPVLEKVAAEVAPKKFRWDYYVHDNIDGKTNAWYPYSAAAATAVEKAYDQWRFGKGATVTQVTSQGDAGTNFTYSIDFKGMKQTNTTSGKERHIRRVPC